MEDRHAREISSSLDSVASALRSLGLSIMFGLMYVGCMISIHH